MIDLLQPGIQRVVDVASRKGVALDIRLMPRSARTAEQAAPAVGADLDEVVKALVFVAPRPAGRLAPIVCLVSGRGQVDLPSLAAVTGEAGIRPATPREVLELTGSSIDAIAPFGHGREIRILMDQDLCGHEWIWAAPGNFSAIFRLAPQTLRMLSNAVVAPISTASLVMARRAWTGPTAGVAAN